MEYEIEDDPQGDAERISGDRDGGLEEYQSDKRRGGSRLVPIQLGEQVRDHQAA